jgi:NADH dehydrogenase
MTEESGQRRVVIVGGGFAGLFAVRALRDSASVTLVDRAAHHLFQPLLYQCSTGILSEGKIAVPLRNLLKKHKNVNCVLAEVYDFDVEGRRVLARRVGGDTIEFGYDDLIVAGGVQQSYFGHPESGAGYTVRSRWRTRPPTRKNAAPTSPSPSSAPARPAWN